MGESGETNAMGATLKRNVRNDLWVGEVYRVSLLRPYWPVTVASFRTWRGWREYVA
jgi:hypothetical protein